MGGFQGGSGSGKRWQGAGQDLHETRTPRIVNYLEMESRNRSLGQAGEEFVVRFETARLIAEGAERLAAMVEHVAATRGDGLDTTSCPSTALGGSG